MLRELGGIQARMDRHGRHAGAAGAARDADPVDVGFSDAGKLADRLLYLGGGYVLALPAKGVADPIDEIEISVRVLAHQVAGAKPAVALLEDIVQDLPVGLDLGGVAFEARARLGCILQNLADHFADLLRPAFYPEALLVSDPLLQLEVPPNHLGGE